MLETISYFLFTDSLILLKHSCLSSNNNDANNTNDNVFKMKFYLKRVFLLLKKKRTVVHIIFISPGDDAYSLCSYWLSFCGNEIIFGQEKKSRRTVIHIIQSLSPCLSSSPSRWALRFPCCLENEYLVELVVFLWYNYSQLPI